MEILCLSSVYTNWRGIVGNYITLCFFALALLMNVSIGVCVVTIRSNLNQASFFLAKFFTANFLVTFSQVYNTLIQLHGDMTCTHRVMGYLTHQIGLTMSSSSLLVLVLAFYKHVKRRMITIEMKMKILKRAIAAQIILDTISISLICVPLISAFKYTFFIGIGFDLTLHLLLIAACCLVKHAVENVMVGSMSTVNLITMKKTFRFLKPTIWMTAIPRILYIFVQLVPVFLRPDQRRGAFLPLRWIGLSYYISFVILPIVVARRNEDIQRCVSGLYSACENWIISRYRKRISNKTHPLEAEKEEKDSPVAVNSEMASYQNQSGGQRMKVSNSNSGKAVELNKTQQDTTSDQVNMIGSSNFRDLVERLLKIRCHGLRRLSV